MSELKTGIGVGKTVTGWQIQNFAIVVEVGIRREIVGIKLELGGRRIISSGPGPGSNTKKRKQAEQQTVEPMYLQLSLLITRVLSGGH